MLQRYLLRETLWPYLLGTLLFIGLVTSDLLSSFSGVFLQRGTHLAEILLLVAYRLPYTFSVALPLGLVFALLVAVARWLRDSELKAALASGISPISLMPGVLGLALVVSGLVFVNLAWIKPAAQVRYDRLLYQIYYGAEPSGVLVNQAYAPPGLGVYFAARVYPQADGARLEDVRVVRPDGSVISAPYGKWEGASWILSKVYVVRANGQLERVSRITLPFSVGFIPHQSNLDALPLASLGALARVDPGARFALERRYADAAAAFVLAWLAVAIGLSLRGAAWAFVTVVLLIFGYYVLWTLAAQLSHFELIGPYGAWLPNVVVGILALVVSWRLR